MNNSLYLLNMKAPNEDTIYKNFISGHFSQKSEYWNLVYDENHDPFNLMNEDFRKRKETVFYFFKKYYDNKEKHVLDLGCGTGVYLKELIEQGFHGIGVDISSEMAHSANEKLNQEEKELSFFMQGDLENLPFPDKSFDCVLCAGTLEFVPDLKRALLEIKRILSSNGILIVTFPNALKMKNIFDPLFYSTYLIRRLRKDSAVNILPNEFRGKKFILRSIIKKLKQTGFLIKDYRGIGFGPIQFFRKNIFSPVKSFRLYKKFQQLSDSKYKFLYHVSNRWVICLQKIS